VIDTHAHLDALDDTAGALERAHAAGVGRILAIGAGVASAKATLAIAIAASGVAVAAGIHPHDAAAPESLDELAAIAEGDVVAIGEIGLDYYRDYAPHDAQRGLFAAQLDLARTLRKPVIVHTRAAEDETLRMLESFDGTVVMHCFSSPAALPAVLERRYYVSFAGNLTYPKAADLREAAAQVAEDRLLAETDAPFLAPQPVRGKTNEPAYLVHTVAALADVRGEQASDLAARIDANADAAFGLS
jgi:TatD DNase family protein